MTGAAFFDLDRTIVRGASGRVFADAMRAEGLLGRPIPGESALFGVFDVLGENLPSMLLARQAASLARGRDREAVRRAAHAAVPVLADMVQPYARAALDGHRREGRAVVLATTTPLDLVDPLAEHLGFDDVVATRYGVGVRNGSEVYDGRIDGHFVWSTGKLAAVRDWAAANHVDLGESYAYSDSVFDVPLLSAVGHPYVVNPDARLVVVAAARRWPTLNLDVAPGVARVPVVGGELQRLLLDLVKPVFFPYVRWDIDGVDNVPDDGPVILVANHRSYFDIAAVAVLMARTRRTVRFLAKREILDAPVIGQIARAMGAIRVDRGSGSAEPLENAAEALRAGSAVAVFPQGTIPRGKDFFDPELSLRHGAARLAAMTKAPLVPIGLWATEQVWPRSARIPNVLEILHPPTVRVRVGPPVGLKYRSPAADTRRIAAAIMELLPEAARAPHTPTDDELRRTFPPGA